jgi:1,2-diacylglycerol 3-alpha-glucosyltransferase
MTESLKISFYTDTFLPAVDGVVISILNFRRELEKRGHEVHIYASGNQKTKQMVKGDRGVTVIPGVTFKKYPQYNLAFFPIFIGIEAQQAENGHKPCAHAIHGWFARSDNVKA